MHLSFEQETRNSGSRSLGAGLPMFDQLSLVKTMTLHQSKIAQDKFLHLYVFAVTFQLPYGTESQEWIKMNAQQTGYYRVNYDTSNWKKLLNQLQTDHMVCFLRKTFYSFNRCSYLFNGI